MKVINRKVGCSAFGLNDSTALDENINSDSNFLLADVLLPRGIQGRILAAEESKQNRLDSGLPWPLESRVESGEYIRRAPVPYVWRALVEAQDSPIRWTVDSGVSFPLTRLLAEHIRALKGKWDYLDDYKLVVAIPDDLDEFGQENLLRDLKAVGCGDTILVWRPIAAALFWLNKTNNGFVGQMPEDDHIHVIYLGADAIELATFRLKREQGNNESFVIPRRNRPNIASSLTGFDWAGVVIEDALKELGLGAGWQAFCQYPEIWATLADIKSHVGKKTELLGDKDGWELWDPQLDVIQNSKITTNLRPSRMLRGLLRQSCPLHWTHPQSDSKTWPQELTKNVDMMLDAYPNGRLRGVLICGPLAPTKIPIWLDSLVSKFQKRGLNLDAPWNTPRVDGLWLAPGSAAIASGASLYGQRLDAGLPTYKDTLPTLLALVKDGWRYQWVPLIDETEVDGGQFYEKIWKSRFQLVKEKRELAVYLKKGSSEEADFSMVDSPESSGENSRYGLNSCIQRLIRTAVRAGWNENEIKKLSSLCDEGEATNYSQSLSQTFSGAKHSSEAAVFSDEKRSLLRSYTFSFPLPPPSNMPVDTEIKIKPASGLATVRLIPADPSFLQGRQVFLNFEKMKKITEIPKVGRGWPEIDELCVDPEDPILRSKKSIKILERLERTDIFKNRSDTWCKPIEILLKSNSNFSVGKKKFLVCYAVDKDGNACTPEANAVIARIADNLGSHFCQLYDYVTNETNEYLLRRACYPKLFDLVMAGSLLFKKTPPIIVSFLRDVLNGNDITLEKWGPFETKKKLFFVAAGRCFSAPENYRVLFQSVCDRIRNMPPPGNFTIQSAGGCLGLLKLRSNAPDGLDRVLANILIQTCLTWLEHEDPGKKLQAKFFRVIRLMLYLLRLRERDENFLDPDSSKTKDILRRFSTFMDDAVKNRVVKGKKEMAVEVKDGFVRYVNYEGTSKTIETLRILSEEENDN